MRVFGKSNDCTTDVFFSRMKLAIQRAAIAAGLLLMLIQPSHASFIGAELRATFFFPDLSTQFGPQETFIVGDPGVELPLFPSNVPNLSLDFSANNLTTGFNRSTSADPGNFNGFVVDDFQSVLPDIESVTVNPATNLVGFTFDFTPNSFSVSLPGIAFTQSSIISLDFTFAGSQVPVPEPGTLALFGVGLAAMAGIRCRRRRPTSART